MMSLLINAIKITSIIIILYTIIPTLYYRITKRKPTKKFKNKNSVLLSFDDGPNEEYTNKLLNLLKRYNIKATFFVIASEAQKHPEVIERIVKEGHSLGLHSLEHKSASLKGYLYTKYDFEKSMKIIKTFGYDIIYYRPPWGEINLFTLYYLKKYNLKLVLWSVMVGDWSKYTSVYDITNRILKRVRGGDIICLHDGRGSNCAPLRTIESLETVIPCLLENGFEFININEFY